MEFWARKKIAKKLALRSLYNCEIDKAWSANFISLMI